MFSDWILLSKLMDCTWRNVTPALCMKFWQLHIWESSYLDEPPCAVESDEKHKMMHVLDWKACSNDSVVDVTPGVEQWHTLWFMWESPRCPEHHIFTTKTMTIVHCFIKQWHHIWTTLLNVFYLCETDNDALQICHCLMWRTITAFFQLFGLMSSEPSNRLSCA